MMRNLRNRSLLLVVTALSLGVVAPEKEDIFNFAETDFLNNDFGPDDWDLIECDDVATCVSGKYVRNNDVGMSSSF